MRDIRPTIVVVTRQTRLEGLKSRWVTASAVKFRLKAAHDIERAQRGAARGGFKQTFADAAADFDEYAREDETYHHVCETLQRELDFGLPVKFLDRSYVPNYDFWNCAAVVVVGQDGLVANTAKYVGATPIVAVNPDPLRFDGVLLPFAPSDARRAVGRVLENKYRRRRVTLAQVSLNDGQKMLAFNDFFIGASSHVSARYTLEVAGRSEAQSSSGVIISTGLGSTGWLKSLLTGATAIAQLAGQALGRQAPPLPGAKRTPKLKSEFAWDANYLFYTVREPFPTRTTGASMVFGRITPDAPLVLESRMAENGVIFSDGIESDFLEFNAGTQATIDVADRKGALVE